MRSLARGLAVLALCGAPGCGADAGETSDVVLEDAEENRAAVGEGWTWKLFPYAGDVWMRSYFNGGGQFDFRVGGGGSIDAMRQVPTNYQALLGPGTPNAPDADRVIQMALWAVNVSASDPAASDPRWNVNLAGTSTNVFMRTVAVEPHESFLDVWSVPDKQWEPTLDDDFAGSDDIPTLTRYEMSDFGILKVRRVIRSPRVKKYGVSQPVKLYLDNWNPMLKADAVFDALALGFDSNGDPSWWYRSNENLPCGPILTHSTRGYSAVFNEGAHKTSRVVGIAFGKQTQGPELWSTTATATYTLWSCDFSTHTPVIATDPTLVVTNAEPDSIVDVEFSIVPMNAITANKASRLALTAANVSAPKVYGPSYAFSGELAAIATRLRSYLNTGVGTRTKHLAGMLP